MTDLEISKALALAIGWELDQIKEHMGSFYCADWPRKDNRKTVLMDSGCYQPPMRPWQKFDYRDWSVIGPIAEKFDLFPVRAYDHNCEFVAWFARSWPCTTADTPQKAIALAVIGSKK